MYIECPYARCRKTLVLPSVKFIPASVTHRSIDRVSLALHKAIATKYLAAMLVGQATFN